MPGHRPAAQDPRRCPSPAAGPPQGPTSERMIASLAIMGCPDHSKHMRAAASILMRAAAGRPLLRHLGSLAAGSLGHGRQGLRIAMGSDLAITIDHTAPMPKENVCTGHGVEGRLDPPVRAIRRRRPEWIPPRKRFARNRRSFLFPAWAAGAPHSQPQSRGVCLEIKYGLAISVTEPKS